MAENFKRKRLILITLSLIAILVIASIAALVAGPGGLAVPRITQVQLYKADVAYTNMGTLKVGAQADFTVTVTAPKTGPVDPSSPINPSSTVEVGSKTRVVLTCPAALTCTSTSQDPGYKDIGPTGQQEWTWQIQPTAVPHGAAHMTIDVSVYDGDISSAEQTISVPIAISKPESFWSKSWGALSDPRALAALPIAAGLVGWLFLQLLERRKKRREET